MDASKYGSVESNEDARKCAELFRSQAGKIDGVLVTLPNFGDERGVANALRWSGLTVPVLVHAFADDPRKMTIRDRRDSFCGKMSVCNNLRQYGVRFTLTRRHTCAPDAPDFLEDLRDFAVTCRVVRGLRQLADWRVGRAAGGLQHRALQRETPRAIGDQRRDPGPLRVVRMDREDGG